MLLECVLLACLLLYAFYSWIFGYWDRRNVFNVKWAFNLGPVVDIFIKRKHIDDLLGVIYNNYKKEGIVGIYSLLTPMMVITDPELAQAVMVKDFTKFVDTAIDIDEKTDLLFSKHSFVAKGIEKWKERRGIQASIQTPAKFKEMLPVMNKVAQTMVQHLKQKKMEPVKVKEMAFTYTVDNSCSCGFGIEPTAFTDPENNFLKYATSDKLFNTSPLAMVCHMLFPSIAKLFKMRFMSKESEEFFLAFSSRITEHRTESNTSRADLISYLIRANKRNLEENKPVYTNVDVAANCLAFYADSTETSSNQLAFFLLDLANHPEVQEKLRKEILSSVGESPKELDLEKIHSIGYLNMALNESMRIHNQVAMLTRICTKDTMLRDVHVPKGTRVLLATGNFQKDPEYFPDPESYDPERFSEQNKASMVKFSFLPFGEGPRMCVGNKFAVLQIKLAIIYLLANFRILPSKDERKEEVGRGDSPILSPGANAMLRFLPLSLDS